MKKLLLAMITSAVLLVCQRASAIAISLLGTSDFAAHDISTITGQTGLGDANLLAWLQAEASTHGFAAPTTDETPYTGGPIAAGDYLVLHYGSGKGGSPQGGLVALYFNADETSFDVPQTGSGPNGLGGLSGAFLFDHAEETPGTPPPPVVPDAGSTLALLGIALGFLGMAHRKVVV
jgi:hypothetical protein